MLLFSARGIHKHFAAGVPGCSALARVLAGVDLELIAGDVIGIVGRRGSGKTTLLRCVAGLARTDAGALRWDDLARRPRFVSISVAAYPFETVGDALERAWCDPAVEASRLEALLGALDLHGLLEKAQFALTTCERSRLALAVGLASAAPLVLLDGAPDTVSAAWRPAVRELLVTRGASGGAVLMAGRDEEGVAALATTRFALRDGRLALLPEEQRCRPPARVAEADTRGAIR